MRLTDTHYPVLYFINLVLVHVVLLLIYFFKCIKTLHHSLRHNQKFFTEFVNFKYDLVYVPDIPFQIA